MSQFLIVTGAIRARPDSFEELKRISLEHVHCSRAEPGCLSHGVAADCDDSLRLVFHEEWESEAALLAHFAVPASRTFAAEAARLAAAPPDLAIFDATRSDLLQRLRG